MSGDTLGELVRRLAAEHTDSPALRLGPDVRSFRDLDGRSDLVARALWGAGVRSGERVAFLGRNSIEFFEFLIGAGKLGAVTVPMNWRLAVPELASVLADSTSRLLVASAEFVPAVEEMVRCGSEIDTLVVLGDGADTSLASVDYDTWITESGTPAPTVDPEPTDVVLQLYTSGTTGKAKGVMSTHAAFTASLAALADAARIEPTSVSLCTLPTFHIGGTSWVLAGVARGCESVMLPDADTGAILAAIDRCRVTNMIAVPTVVQRLVESDERLSFNLESLETIYYGGGPMSESVIHRALETFNCRFVQGFGLTELPLVTALPPEAHETDPALLRSCGQVVPNTELRLVDALTGSEVPLGAVGELYVRSPRMMIGYWNQPTATDQAIDSEGWLHTGDAARMDEQGFIYIQDRVKDMVVTGGENVYPAEVENALMEHFAVAECAVIGVPSEKWGETVKALVVLRDPGAVDETELISFCRQRLARYKCPTSIDFVPELPRTPSGKLIKYRLRQQFGPISPAGSIAGNSSLPPSSPDTPNL